MLLSTPKDAAEVTVGGGAEHESFGSERIWFVGPHASGGDAGGGAWGTALTLRASVEEDAGGGACGAAPTLRASNEEIMKGAEMEYMMRWYEMKLYSKQVVRPGNYHGSSRHLDDLIVRRIIDLN